MSAFILLELDPKTLVEGTPEANGAMDLETINLLAPRHERSTCNDNNLFSAPFEFEGRWRVKCERCALLTLFKEVGPESDFARLG